MYSKIYSNKLDFAQSYAEVGQKMTCDTIILSSGILIFMYPYVCMIHVVTILPLSVLIMFVMRTKLMAILMLSNVT